MNNILIGRYIPGTSLIHKMDPRGKLITSFLFVMIIFLANNCSTYAVLFVFALLAVCMTKISFKIFWRGIRPLIWLILFTVIMQLLFTGSGKVLWHVGFLKVTDYGIISSIYMCIRLITIIVVSTVFTLTTTSLQIADAIEWLIHPLKYLKVPVGEIALVLSIALRFVPTLMDEATKIINAQKARGSDISTGKFIEKIKKIVPILVPLFIRSLSIALDLAVAMEARGYRDGMPRSRYRQLAWHIIDILNLGSLAILIGLLLLLRRY